jgi:hypothetical protein
MIGWLVVSVVLLASASLTVYIGKKSFCLTQTLVALLVQIFLAVTFFMIWGLQGDASTYHTEAQLFVELWSTGSSEGPFMLPAGKQSTAWIAGVIYWLVGPLPVVYLLFLAIFTAMIPALLSTTTRLFDFPSAAPLAAWLGVFAPPFLFWAPWMRRESLVFVFVGMTLATVGLIYNSRWETSLIMWSGTAVVFIVSRPQLLLILAFGSIIAVLLRKKKTQSNFRQSAFQYGMAIFMVMISGTAIFWSLSSELNGSLQQDTRQAILASNSNPAQGLAVPYEPTPSSDTPDKVVELGQHKVVELGQHKVVELGQHKVVELGQHKVVELGQHKVVELGQRFINSTVGPLPWQWSSRSWIIAGLDGLFMLCIWLLVAVGFIRYPQVRKMTLIIVAAALPLIAGEAYMHANYGITMRVRAHYLIVLLPLISVILSLLASSLSNRRTRMSQTN